MKSVSAGWAKVAVAVVDDVVGGVDCAAAVVAADAATQLPVEAEAAL